jgi:hypothetical protein
MNRITRAALEAASLAYGVPIHLILSPSRETDYVRARRIVISLLRSRGQRPSHIAREMGGMDHSSIIRALERIQEADDGWKLALERAQHLFSKSTRFFDGVIVYEAPIGPPNKVKCPRDKKWEAALGERKFESARVPVFTGSYRAAMSEEAASVAREV